ncbi:MFS transporter [Corynebacterium doosanense]|uniref:Membrane protein n=1 Tax=Corynebacterium doosanense CAU 212 = DSM 45436 TaxID=558173 RepID=A0A097IH03_9CORY|nr:membrane protein [Corynebacterium doosanense CAU 212 = DSM 45436]
MSPQVLPRAEIERLDSMWKSPGFTPTLVAIAAAFGAWSLLLPVIPLAVLDSGGSAGLAGASTGVFMLATVITQMFTPLMLRRIGYNPVMVAAAFMLGVPALGHLLGTEAWVVLLFSALRGIGFGALTVAEAALVAELVPVRFLGKATGTMGVFIGLAQMIMLPAGLFLAQAAGYDTVYITAAVVALIAVLMCLRIPRLKAAPARPASAGQVAGEPQHVPMWKLVLVPALALTTLSMSFGAVSSFLPAAVVESNPAAGAVIGGFMLSIVGGSAMVPRYLAGVIADRTGQPGGLIIYAQVAGLAGMALMAATVAWGWPVWLLVVAAVLFGGGFGAVQNEALLSMFQRLPRSKVSQASAVWNIFYDAGTGIGSVVYGAIVAAWYYSGAFTAGALIIVVGIALTVADRIVGRHRVSEYDNIRTRLQRVRPAARRRTTLTQADLPPRN